MDQLPHPLQSRSLTVILSGCAIAQCVFYRIDQKLAFLQGPDTRVRHVKPAQAGYLQSLLPLCHTVIVYRTAVSDEILGQIRRSGARLVFEFDDLVVGEEAMRSSGVLSEVNEVLAGRLLAESEEFLRVARAADALIVSTPRLREIYARPGSPLEGKPILVVPNFLPHERFLPTEPVAHDFAYTSPSKSVQSELRMLKAFLRSFDDTASRPWSILVMGNELVAGELRKEGYVHGTVNVQPFSGYDDYLRSLATVGLVLIPLSDSDFNACKTPIRLIDATLAGAGALFSDVGAYGEIARHLGGSALAVGPEEWADRGREGEGLLSRREELRDRLRGAVTDLYGAEAARRAYEDAFAGGVFRLPPSGRHRDAA